MPGYLLQRSQRSEGQGDPEEGAAEEDCGGQHDDCREQEEASDGKTGEREDPDPAGDYRDEGNGPCYGPLRCPSFL